MQASSERDSGTGATKLSMETIGLSMDKLHSSLLMEILSRLPMKNLSHCRCVSKTWLRLIGNPEFIKLYSSRSSTTGILMRSVYGNSNRRMIKHQLSMVEEQATDIGFQVVERMSFPRLVNLPNAEFEIVGSCHGLICLYQEILEHEDDTEDIEWDYVYVCNPILREFITIPVDRYRKFKCTTGVSFGYCASTNQYKVVQTYDPIDEDSYDDGPVAEVYTLGTGQWRSIGDALSSIEYACSSFDTFLHSSVHWIGSKEKYTHDSLHCFDFEKEEFRELPSPPCVRNYSSMKLGVLNGCLSATFSTTDDPEKLGIWVMKEYGKDSWAKHFVIGNSSGDINYLSPLVSFNDGKILMMCRSSSHVVCYNIESGVIEETQMFQTRVSEWYPYKYTPCFFSLEDVAGKEKLKKLRLGKRKTTG
ncbi:F-box protein At3g07870 [Linum perenne]